METLRDIFAANTGRRHPELLAQYDAALEHAAAPRRGARLVAVADALPTADHCDGTMTCLCTTCAKDRLARVRAGSQDGKADNFRRVSRSARAA